MISRRNFMAAAGAAAFAGAVGRLAAQSMNAAPPFKTVLKKALIAKRFDAALVQKLKDAGYPGVELSDKTVTVDEARVARRLAEDSGLQIHSFMGGWFEFNSKDPAKRKAAIETAKRNIQITAAYGAPVILVVPGRIGGINIPKPSQFSLKFDPGSLALISAVEGDNAPFADYIAAQNDATKYAREAVEELIPVAASEGVIIGLENVWNNLWVKPDFAAAFIRSFASPWVKAYYDIGNHVRYARSEEWLSALSDQIVKLHIKDFKIDREAKNEGSFVRIGDGSIDWKSVRRAIDSIGYSGWISIESSGWTDAEHSAIMDRFFAGTL
jgi:hexulose-6-phosphate isomerase